MFEVDWKKLNACALVSILTLVVSVTLAPVTPALAQMRTLPDFTDLVEQVGPSVVNIRTLEKVSSRIGTGGAGEEEMLEFFRRFGLPIPNMPRQAPRQNHPQLPEEQQPHGLASGFILSADGLIMTNAHVVDGADEVMVTLTDKREFKAKIIGVDQRSDIALVNANYLGLELALISERHHHFVSTINHVRIGHNQAIRREDEARGKAVRLLFLWQLGVILTRCLAWHIGNRQTEATEELQHFLLTGTTRTDPTGDFFKGSDVHHRRTHLFHQICKVRQSAHLGQRGCHRRQCDGYYERQNAHQSTGV